MDLLNLATKFVAWCLEQIQNCNIHLTNRLHLKNNLRHPMACRGVMCAHPSLPAVQYIKHLKFELSTEREMAGIEDDSGKEVWITI